MAKTESITQTSTDKMNIQQYNAVLEARNEMLAKVHGKEATASGLQFPPVNNKPRQV